MSSNPQHTAEGLDFGTVPAELVWFVSPETEAYDVLLYRAMAADYHLAEAFAGAPWGGMWISWPHYEWRWEPFERATLALLGPGAS